MIPEMIKNEDDKINDKNVMITKMIKKNEKKSILTWPSLWLQVFHKLSHYLVLVILC